MKTSGVSRTLVAGACVLLLLMSAVPATGATAPEGTAKASPARPIDINVASAEELTAVPGIGKALAQRIVEFREKEGPFRRVEDLLKIRGIGEKSFEKLRPYVKVERRG